MIDINWISHKPFQICTCDGADGLETYSLKRMK